MCVSLICKTSRTQTHGLLILILLCHVPDTFTILFTTVIPLVQFPLSPHQVTLDKPAGDTLPPVLEQMAVLPQLEGGGRRAGTGSGVGVVGKMDLSKASSGYGSVTSGSEDDDKDLSSSPSDVTSGGVGGKISLFFVLFVFCRRYLLRLTMSQSPAPQLSPE